MHVSETTNGRLAEARAIVRELIEWADADVENSRESKAPEQVRRFRRATALRKALALLDEAQQGGR